MTPYIRPRCVCSLFSWVQISRAQWLSGITGSSLRSVDSPSNLTSIFERHLSGSPLAYTHSDNEALFPGSYPASRFRWFGASLSADFGTYKHRFFGDTRYRLKSTRLTDCYRSQAHSRGGPAKFLVRIRQLASGKPLNKSPGG